MGDKKKNAPLPASSAGLLRFFEDETKGVKIDPNVTVDIHRIFRLEGSLNSKSGLAKLACDNIEKFNPYAEACLIGDEPVEISASLPIEFRLKNRRFGPYTNEKISVPKYAATYMLCKGIANLV